MRIPCLCLPILLTLAPAAAGQPAVVTRPVATMFTTPSLDSDVSSQVLLGQRLEVLELKPGWARVRSEDAYEGWMAQGDFRPLKAGEPIYAAQGRVARVEALLANAYREPDVTKHAPVAVIPYGAKVELTGERKDARWVEVRLPAEAKAWIQVGDLTEDLRPLTVEESLALAKRFLGVPYTWGGGSALGLDCSGLTQILLRSRGVLMPRDADVQCTWAGLVPVAREHLWAGDLLFFGPSPQKITHTGMVLGEGRFIHATTNGRPVVQVSNLEDAPWKGLLVACRRAK
ncbi:MAG TPA: NlpC/P60 family protein [Holophagaceae bacterium]|nr:NlpC/P60 family protein [Holophagaceae bacterium]